MKLLHTADIHLVNPSLQEGRHRLRVLEEICQKAQNYDVLVISGDMFDSADCAKSLEAPVRKALAAARPAKVIIIPGNHDLLRGDNPFSGKFDFGQDDNVKLLVKQPFDMTVSGGVEFYGFPFQKSRTTTELFKNVPAKTTLSPRVAILHGTPADRLELAGFGLGEENREEGGDLLIKDADVKNLSFSYAALGHIHRHDKWNPGSEACLLSYPGSPDAIRITEQQEKTINEVIIDEEGRSSVSTVPLLHAARAERRTFFVFPGSEEQIMDGIDSFLTENQKTVMHGIVIEGLGDVQKINSLKTEVAHKWKGKLPLGIDFKLLVEDTSGAATDMIMYAFLRRMRQLVEEAGDSKHKQEILRRSAVLGWRALLSQKLEPEDILGGKP